jgi:hypothetical protein
MSVKLFLMNQPAAETAGYLKNIHNCTEYRHSGLDPESSSFLWIPAFAGMTNTMVNPVTSQ